MDPEIKALLKENIKISKENNELLKKVRGYQKWSQTTKAIYWVIVLASVFGAWYFIQPYLDVMFSYFGVVSGLNSNLNNIQNFSDVKNIQNLLQQLQ